MTLDWHFDLFREGVYGDVHRVKILFNKKDNALIQMAEPHQAQLGRCHELSHVMRLWYFSSSINTFFKRACAAIQWGYMSEFRLDPSSTSILHVGTVKALARLCRWAIFAGCLCDKYIISQWIWLDDTSHITRNPVFGGVQPGKTQTNLLSYRV